MSRRTLLFLGASVSQLAAIKHAREIGFRVVAVDGNPNAIAFAHADVGEIVDFTDVEEVVEVGAKQSVDGVLAISSDRAVAPAAAVAEALGLPGIGVDVAHGFTNKGEMRARLAYAGIPQPRSRVITSAAEIEAAFAALAPPVVLKPADSGGQRGIFLVDTVEAIRAHLPETLAVSRGGQAILEEYLDGIELNGLLAVRGGDATVLTSLGSAATEWTRVRSRLDPHVPFGAPRADLERGGRPRRRGRARARSARRHCIPAADRDHERRPRCGGGCAHRSRADG